MYISRVTLNRGPALFNVLKQQRGGDAYLLHQLLWGLFPNDGSKKRDFLFRKDKHERLPKFYLVSQYTPVANDVFSVETKPYSPQIGRGEQLGFSLTANPTVSRKRLGNKNSAAHDVWMDAKCAARKKSLSKQETVRKCEEAAVTWLKNRGALFGFNLIDTTVDGYVQHRVFQKSSARPIQFSSIDFNGRLSVTDPERFVEMLYRGIGKSRALGCGLMLVRRV